MTTQILLLSHMYTILRHDRVLSGWDGCGQMCTIFKTPYFYCASFFLEITIVLFFSLGAFLEEFFRCFSIFDIHLSISNIFYKLKESNSISFLEATFPKDAGACSHLHWLLPNPADQLPISGLPCRFCFPWTLYLSLFCFFFSCLLKYIL